MKKELNDLIVELLITGINMGAADDKETHDRNHARASVIFTRIDKIMEELEERCET